MLSLHTNAAALSTQNSLSATHKALSTSQTRLGTGLRVNSAMDDAAGLQIATRLNAQSRGQTVAMRNTQNGISMLQTAEGAFNEVTNILLRMKDLATEGVNATASTNDKAAMQSEYDSLGRELTNIMKNTSFGGQKLFAVGVDAAAVNGSTGTLAATGGISFQIGATADEQMKTDVSTAVSGLTADTGALGAISATFKTTAIATTKGTEVGAAATITSIDAAIEKVNSLRGDLGAGANRLDHVYNNLQNMNTNTQAARGRIMDVDYATESANMTSKQMLMQAGTSMLKQSSSLSQLTLSLLQ